jgi:hypothetical protein
MNKIMSEKLLLITMAIVSTAGLCQVPMTQAMGEACAKETEDTGDNAYDKSEEMIKTFAQELEQKLKDHVYLAKEIDTSAVTQEQNELQEKVILEESEWVVKAINSSISDDKNFDEKKRTYQSYKYKLLSMLPPESESRTIIHMLWNSLHEEVMKQLRKLTSTEEKQAFLMNKINTFKDTLLKHEGAIPVAIAYSNLIDSLCIDLDYVLSEYC